MVQLGSLHSDTLAPGVTQERELPSGNHFDTIQTFEELIEIVPGPDFPTGAVIHGRKGIYDYITTGRGRVVVRAKTDIEVEDSGRAKIIVHEIPYQVNKAELLKKIADLVREKRLEGISDIRDESDRDGLRVVIELKRDAHGEIVLNHGSEARPLSCYTCHKKDERDFLITEEGTKIDMDHSYQMCGQCHFRQKKDWVGGAHGKRVSWWAGDRVVKNCTSCHDPHAPRFKKQWPETYSRSLTE